MKIIIRDRETKKVLSEINYDDEKTIDSVAFGEAAMMSCLFSCDVEYKIMRNRVQVNSTAS
ncbi:MAG TPA: hypothetical protein VMZ91_15395 [Candidatus Paceibacterota bacterium]|nr:hypothetical protein [Candidatus Paceibacterota bacterium]